MNNILPKKALRSLNTYRPAVAEKKTKDNLKASAKAKLIAGEALTEEEANTIVL